MHARPVLAHVAARHPAQRMTRRGMDDGEIEVADEQRQSREHEAVVEDDRAREAEPRVALAEPQEEAGGEEEDRERSREDRVDLLADVEPVVVKALELARRAQQAAAVAEDGDERE